MKAIIKPTLFSLLTVAASLTAASHSAIAKESLEALLNKKAATIERMHYKAKKALVTAAQDKTFAKYFHAHTDGERVGHKHKIDEISLSVQNRFRVEEMCLIDPKGAEISRIVGREIADDLADDEASAGFFAPGFAAEPRKVHVSKIYMSADANKWVVAYVTPIVVNDEKKAILHFEHTLHAYQEALNRDVSNDGKVMLAVDADGYIVSDSRSDIGIEIKDGVEDRKAYFKHFSLSGMSIDEVRKTVGQGGPSGSGKINDYHVTYKMVGDWTVLAVAGL